LVLLKCFNNIPQSLIVLLYIFISKCFQMFLQATVKLHWMKCMKMSCVQEKLAHFAWYNLNNSIFSNSALCPFCDILRLQKPPPWPSSKVYLLPVSFIHDLAPGTRWSINIRICRIVCMLLTRTCLCMTKFVDFIFNSVTNTCLEITNNFN